MFLWLFSCFPNWSNLFVFTFDQIGFDLCLHRQSDHGLQGFERFERFCRNERRIWLLIRPRGTKLFRNVEIYMHKHVHILLNISHVCIIVYRKCMTNKKWISIYLQWRIKSTRRDCHGFVKINRQSVDRRWSFKLSRHLGGKSFKWCNRWPGLLCN